MRLYLDARTNFTKRDDMNSDIAKDFAYASEEVSVAIEITDPLYMVKRYIE